MSKNKIYGHISQYNGYLAKGTEGAFRGLEIATFCLGGGQSHGSGPSKNSWGLLYPQESGIQGAHRSPHKFLRIALAGVAQWMECQPVN